MLENGCRRYFNERRFLVARNKVDLPQMYRRLLNQTVMIVSVTPLCQI